MGNTYVREDSLESNGRASRSSSILRKYSKSLKCKDSEGVSKAPSTDDPSEAGEQKTKDSVERQDREGRGDMGEKNEQEGEEPPSQLTEEQKETVKRTWKIIEASVAKVGVVLFMGLFETHPDVQEVFTPFRGLPMEQVQQSKELRAHALRVMGFVEKAVRRLDQPEKLVPLVQECGRNHCHYGAQVQHISLVGPQFLQAIRPALEDEWTEEVELAWDLLMKNIAYVMKRSMREEMKH
ncbi:cytoglobin-2 [Procambarus clarkii]|uniref:cytoglobin-2 n=1 Tax=Procambarus clarkii TaxID=6728 RepID=UPI001E671A08|nr:leghemoglobin 49-like [Procambarus clarkii]